MRAYAKNIALRLVYFTRNIRLGVPRSVPNQQQAMTLRVNRAVVMAYVLAT
jgi:hypothetical protein